MHALEQTRYNKTAAAKLLGVTFRALRYRIKKLGIEVSRAGASLCDLPRHCDLPCRRQRATLGQFANRSTEQLLWITNLRIKAGAGTGLAFIRSSAKVPVAHSTKLPENQMIRLHRRLHADRTDDRGLRSSASWPPSPSRQYSDYAIHCR